ncbi:MAG: phosphate acyltransferase PlsX [Clostridia bacterium]|nr:phosphate acyltransferase PlsX [Clostridia bacterium]
MSKIIVDAFGGDHAPLAVLQGAAAAREEFGADILLVGDEQKIKDCAAEHQISLDGLSIHHAPDVISMHDDPALVIKGKKDTSSMGVGLQLLKDGAGDVFVSAGSTGALVMGTTFLVKRRKGVKRCAIATVMPAKDGPTVILDSGANADCRPELLHQFAVLGAEYAAQTLDIKNPRVGLLNIGAEDTKGDELRLETYQILKEDETLNFVGNIEAREIPDSKCDVLVCDGFAGNIAIKSIEGTAAYMMGIMKQSFTSSLRMKLGAALVMPGLRTLKKKLDYSELGGAPLLGAEKPVFKAHGSSNAKAFKNAIRVAKKTADAAR